MRAEERRHASGIANDAQLCELGLSIEPVSGLGLVRRRSAAQHPGGVEAECSRQSLLPCLARGANGREDPAPRCVELLVAGTCGAQRKLRDAIAREARVRVAVDEPRNRTQPATVDLLDFPAQRREVAHCPNGGDTALLAEDVRALDDVDGTEVGSPERRWPRSRRRNLREVADEERPRTLRRRRSHASAPAAGSEGRSSPWRRAADTASS